MEPPVNPGRFKLLWGILLKMRLNAPSLATPNSATSLEQRETPDARSALITRRSGVRIPPPLPNQTPLGLTGLGGVVFAPFPSGPNARTTTPRWSGVCRIVDYARPRCYEERPAASRRPGVGLLSVRETFGLSSTITLFSWPTVSRPSGRHERRQHLLGFRRIFCMQPTRCGGPSLAHPAEATTVSRQRPTRADHAALIPAYSWSPK